MLCVKKKKICQKVYSKSLLLSLSIVLLSLPFLFFFFVWEPLSTGLGPWVFHILYTNIN